MEEHAGAGILVRVDVPDLKSQTRIVISKTDPVGLAKQAVLEKLSHDWPIDVANNYGFYIPPTGRKKVGRFLDESRPLIEEQSGVITHLEFRYKRRDLNSLGLSEKAIAKANSKSNMKKLVDHVTSGSVKKIEKLLDAGLDPNFIMEDGNTPLGLACGRNGRSQCINPLIYGGAIIDFRGSSGLTPIHRAAIGGNVQALKVLLSLGASPNYIDAKGQTPLYHAAIMGDDVSVCELLLKNNSVVMNTDNIGWTELHQVAKHGYVHLIDMMLSYGADINAINKAGNTPLHVAAQHGQLDVAIHLLRRGANPYILNSSKQPPNQSAILCGHHNLAKEIANFMKEDIDPIEVDDDDDDPGERWGLERRGSFGSHEKELSPTSYSSKTLPSSSRGKTGAAVGAPKLIKGQSLTNLTQQPKAHQVPSLSTSPPSKYNITKKAPIVPAGTKRPPKGKPVEEERERTESPIKNESPPAKGHHRYSTDRKTSPKPSHHSLPLSSPGTSLAMRERLYPVATPGKKYVVTMNVDPQQDGDLHLTRGMVVEVLYVGKGGFWEGKAGDNTGWFPQHAIIEKTDGWDDQDPAKVKEEKQTTKRKSGIKAVSLTRGPKGFGFAMRGIKDKFKPSPKFPALQYVGRVDKGSSADISGLQKGDYIIEVNGINTTNSTHEEVVSIIKQSNDNTLQLKVISPLSAKDEAPATSAADKQPKGEVAKDDRCEESPTQETATHPTGNSSPRLQAWGTHSQESDEEEEEQKAPAPSLKTAPHSMTPPDRKRIIQASPSSSPHSKLRSNPSSSSPLPSNANKSSPLTKHSLHANRQARGDKNDREEIGSDALTSNKNPDMVTSRSEELMQKEEENFEKLMAREEEDEEEEEGLSELAKQLRKASRDRYKRAKAQPVPASPPSKIKENKVPITTTKPPKSSSNITSTVSNTGSSPKASSATNEFKASSYSPMAQSSSKNKPLVPQNDSNDVTTGSQSPVTPLKHDHFDDIPQPLKEIDDRNDNDDDGWEYTETLTTYADIITPTASPKQYKIDSAAGKSKNDETKKRDEQASLRVEHLKKSYLSSKQNTAPSPKGQRSQKQQGLPKNQHSPVMEHSTTQHSSSQEQPAIQHSPSLKQSLLKQQPQDTPSPKQHHSPLLSEERHFPSKQKQPSVQNERLNETGSPSLPAASSRIPPPIKPKPSGSKDDLIPPPSSSHPVIATSAAASVASLAKNFSSPKKSRRDSRERQHQTKKDFTTAVTVSNQEETAKANVNRKEEPDDKEPEPQPVMSLKDKFEKMAQSKKPSPPAPIKPKPKKQLDPVKPVLEPIKHAFDPLKQSVPVTEPIEPAKPVPKPLNQVPEPAPVPSQFSQTVPEPEIPIEDFLPPPVFEGFDSNRFSIISVEELPIPAELLTDDALLLPPPLEDDKVDFLPPPLYNEDQEDEESSFELPPPPLPAMTDEEQEYDELQDLPPPSFALPHQFEDNIIEETKEEIPLPTAIQAPTDFSTPPLSIASTGKKDKELPLNERKNEETATEKKRDEEPLPLPLLSSDGGEGNDNLLDNIVGELIKLTNGNDDDDDDDDDDDSDSAGSPPPLPSRPPPDSDEEEEEEKTGNYNIQQQGENLVLHNVPLSLEKEPLEASKSTSENLPLVGDELPPYLPPPLQRDSVFFEDGETFDNSVPPPDFEDDFIPPPTIGEEDEGDMFEPPSFEEEALPPPPLEEDDLLDDPLLPDEVLPPPFDEGEGDNAMLPPPPTAFPDNLDLPPPLFDDDPSDQELSNELLLPPVLMQDNEDDNFKFPPPSPPPSFPSPSPPPPSSDVLRKHLKDEGKDISAIPFSNAEQTSTEKCGHISTWSVDKVCSWLTEIGLEIYSDAFHSNEICGEHLIDLSRDDLKDLGITKVGHIKTLKQKLNDRLQV